jgi:hypothetical protein
VEVGSYLGLPADSFLASDEPDEYEVFRLNTEYPEDNDVLLTLCEGGHTTVCRISGDEESLELGVSTLPLLQGFERSRSLKWSGEMPKGGIHLDLDEKSLVHWWARTTSCVDERVRRAWPGWDARWLRDAYEEHLRIADVEIALPERPVRTLLLEALSHVRRYAHHEATNPARKLGPKVRAEEINPWTNETRGSLGDVAEKQRILDELASSL